MSFDRWYLPYIRLTSVLAFSFVVIASGQADDAWHNVYHSLKKFFAGKSSSNSTVHHRVKRSEHSTQATSSPSPEATPTPRVVILPAMSPSPGPENPARVPETVVKPEPSPDQGPVLRSLPGPTPVSSPTILPSPE
jgi:hypothetical protein